MQLRKLFLTETKEAWSLRSERYRASGWRGRGGAWGEAVNASHRNLAVSCFSLLKSRALLESFFLQTASSFHDEGGSRRKPLLFSFMG